MQIKLVDKYLLLLIGISVLVAVLMHYPEILSLVDADPEDLFPGMSAADVTGEVLFTIFSLVLLFSITMFVFGFDKITTRIGWNRILFAFIFTWILSSLLGQAFVYLHHRLDIPGVDAILHYYLHPLRDFILSCVIVGSSYILYLIRYSGRVQIENQQLQAENLLNQYEALKNQLNPHMLFNSLNTLRSLIREAPGKAQEYVQELSRVLRYTLQENENKGVSLRKEMEFVRSFIFLLKMRYEDNLYFDIKIHLEDETRSLPPMSVQMLVENAVKHNEISSRHPLIVRIWSDGEKLTVSNPIQPKRTPYVGAGIGLTNLNKRYQLLYNKEIRIKKENEEFTVIIPLI